MDTIQIVLENWDSHFWQKNSFLQTETDYVSADTIL